MPLGPGRPTCRKPRHLHPVYASKSGPGKLGEPDGVVLIDRTVSIPHTGSSTRAYGSQYPMWVILGRIRTVVPFGRWPRCSRYEVGTAFAKWLPAIR